jgi:hypothetical protein
MEPSKKTRSLEQLLENIAGRSTAIITNRCIDPSFGCGGPAVEFRDELSAREYTISGLCQKCQDLIWSPE